MNPAIKLQDVTTYQHMRNNAIRAFLPYATHTTQTTEEAFYHKRLAANNGYLETIIYGNIWEDLLPNERLAIEHLYYENPSLVDKNTRLYTNIHDYVSANIADNTALANEQLKHALWEIIHNSPSPSDNTLEQDKTRHRRLAQATLLNSLNIPTIEIHTPDYVIHPIRQRYVSIPLETLLPDIVFPLKENAQQIAEEIQQINAEIQQVLQHQKSIVTTSRTIPEATGAFVELTENIVGGVHKKIEEEISEQAKQSKTEAEIREHIDGVIAHYQDTTIPHKMHMLATHFNGKLTEVRLRESGARNYVWISMDDEKVRPDHAANDGRIFSLDNPPDTGHPGHEYNCRCQAAPIRLAGRGKLIRQILESIFKKADKKVKDAAGKIKKNPKIQPSVRNPESLRGKSAREVEKIADKELLSKGWKKEPLRDGNGIRYTDGKGGSFEINRGYPNSTGGDKTHKGPYLKTTVGSNKVREPLKGNPELK